MDQDLDQDQDQDHDQDRYGRGLGPGPGPEPEPWLDQDQDQDKDTRLTFAVTNVECELIDGEASVAGLPHDQQLEALGAVHRHLIAKR